MLYSPFSDDAATHSGLVELGRIVDVIPSLQLDGLTTCVWRSRAWHCAFCCSLTWRLLKRQLTIVCHCCVL